MPDTRFFQKSPALNLRDLLGAIGVPTTENLPDKMISDVAGLDDAGADQISFLDNKRYLPALANTQAGAVVLEQQYVERLPEHVIPIVSETPYRTFALISQYFYPSGTVDPYVSPDAAIDPTATIGAGCRIEAGAVVSANAEIGDNCYIGPNAVIDNAVKLGADSHVGAGAYLGFCLVGNRANIHPGVRIGTRGFGFAMDRKGHIDVPQLGRVVIGDGVEIGANTTIDRGMGPDTEIGDFTKIDNLVQIGHNVKIGKACVIVAMTGIAGSTVLEDYVVCAAQSGIAGHLRIGKGAQIAAKAGVMKNLAAGEKVGGVPAVPLNQWLREHVFINKLMRKKERKDG
ncbi:UDP-3-O-(3-hydroxymyristoyl)glucosamine N-acyltransferase [Aestuariispira insulae]|uniref:UDP-3-O-acylglucosamine N-acyltransferase n=1 Tax=Aestuariispira insulae TaxID=1461337 RepID=A0A3D9HUX5_9PROT|nr:UDP-3-O-(3-hydroxymyristoyl)glucosamine N-acyltransferase [Aestuariispira insulae]RED53292.1 UDP-3-O-[3-hydroxymyristoyl] glucosamine N-acyltransferase [Aestuariispira insulae]